MVSAKKVASVRSVKKKVVSKKTTVSSRLGKVKSKATNLVNDPKKEVKKRKKLPLKTTKKGSRANESVKIKNHTKTSKKNNKNTSASSSRLLPTLSKAPVTLMLFSAIKLPVNLDIFAVQTARIGGLMILVLGAAFTLLYSQYIWNAPLDDYITKSSGRMTASAIEACGNFESSQFTEFEQCVKHNIALNIQNNAGTSLTSESSSYSEGVSQSSSTTTDSASTDLATDEIIVNDLEDAETFVKKPPVTFRVDKAEPLSGIVTIFLSVDKAKSVDVSLANKTYENISLLGTAVQVDHNIWKYEWDTTGFDDASYKVIADVTRLKTFKPYRNSDGKYLEVSNSAKVDEPSDLPKDDSASKPPVKLDLASKNPIKGIANFLIKVDDATNVTVFAKHTPSGSLNELGDAVFKTGNIWNFSWDTDKYTDGDYIISTKIKNTDGVYRKGYKEVVVSNIIDTATTTDLTDSGELDASPETDSEVLLELPEAQLHVNKDLLSGVVTIEVDIDSTKYVELWVRPEESNIDKIIGLARRKSPTSDTWVYRWNTRSTPNGKFTIYAKVNNSFGIYESNTEKISVFNKPFKPELTKEQVKEVKAIQLAKEVEKEVKDKDEQEKEEKKKNEQRKEQLTQADEKEDKIIPVVSSTVQENKILKKETRERTETQEITDSFSKEITEELRRLTTAYRSGDESRISRAEERIELLKKDISASVTGDLRTDKLLKNINADIDQIVVEHKVLAKKVETLIKERVGEDVFKDSDSDGISDYDERTLYKTDPYSADSDGDGFNDGAEVAEGYDPLDVKREVAVAYESPIERGVVREDILVVESIVALTPDDPTDDTDGVKAQAVISGKALPNSFITLYVFSTPTVVTVKTEADGSWQYRFDKELEDGEHNIYVGVTDNAGRIVAKSAAFTFVKEAQAFSAVDASVIDTLTNEPSDTSLLSSYMIYLILSISVVAIGLVLILLGLHLETRQRKFGAAVNKDNES